FATNKHMSKRGTLFTARQKFSNFRLRDETTFHHSYGQIALRRRQLVGKGEQLLQFIPQLTQLYISRMAASITTIARCVYKLTRRTKASLHIQIRQGH